MYNIISDTHSLSNMNSHLETIKNRIGDKSKFSKHRGVISILGDICDDYQYSKERTKFIENIEYLNNFYDIIIVAGNNDIISNSMPLIKSDLEHLPMSRFNIVDNTNKFFYNVYTCPYTNTLLYDLYLYGAVSMKMNNLNDEDIKKLLPIDVVEDCPFEDFAMNIEHPLSDTNFTSMLIREGRSISNIAQPRHILSHSCIPEAVPNYLKTEYSVFGGNGNGKRFDSVRSAAYATRCESMMKEIFNVLCMEIFLTPDKVPSAWYNGHFHTSSTITLDMPQGNSMLLVGLGLNTLVTI